MQRIGLIKIIFLNRLIKKRKYRINRDLWIEIQRDRQIDHIEIDRWIDFQKDRQMKGYRQIERESVDYMQKDMQIEDRQKDRQVDNKLDSVTHILVTYNIPDFYNFISLRKES